MAAPTAAYVVGALRAALDRRFPGTGSIGPWVSLDGLHGYDATVACEVLDDAFGVLGLTFRRDEIARHRHYLADLIELVDRGVATRLHHGYVMAAAQPVGGRALDRPATPHIDKTRVQGLDQPRRV